MRMLTMLAIFTAIVGSAHRAMADGDAAKPDRTLDSILVGSQDYHWEHDGLRGFGSMDLTIRTYSDGTVEWQGFRWDGGSLDGMPSEEIGCGARGIGFLSQRKDGLHLQLEVEERTPGPPGADMNRIMWRCRGGMRVVLPSGTSPALAECSRIGPLETTYARQRVNAMSCADADWPLQSEQRVTYTQKTGKFTFMNESIRKRFVLTARKPTAGDAK